MIAPERPRSSHRFQILLCEGPSCGITHESECLKHHLEGKIATDPDLKSRVHVFDYMCFGRCSEGPNLFVRRLAPGERADVEPPATTFSAELGFYPEMNEEKCDRVLVGHCALGEPVAGLVEDY